MKYTPQIIVEKGTVFTIPLYQRLFEWSVENVIQLMDDLNRAFEKATLTEEDSNKNDYYIGMLTSTTVEDNDQKLQLVDGQQRFTVMTLIACVMQSYDSSWKDFLLVDGRPRLTFISRKADDAYLVKLIQKEYKYFGELTNVKMKEAIDAIITYMSQFDDNNKLLFARFIYRHLCFFISELPKSYSGQDLNKYFERMNSSGKNLEHHEILKVKILSKLDGNVSLYMQLWNKIADVDTILLRKREYKKESETDFRNRKNNVLTASLSDIEANPEWVNSLKQGSNDTAKSIREISAREKKPQDTFLGHYNGSKSVLKFPQLLLQVLFYYLKKRDGDSFQPRLDDFFNHFFGFTAENQEWFDRRMKIVEDNFPDTPKLWLSAEPLLGPIELHGGHYRYFDWVVVGCESGPKRRPCEIKWIEDIVDACLALEIPVFVKQLVLPNGMFTNKIDDFPKHLQVRQVPWRAEEVGG